MEKETVPGCKEEFLVSQGAFSGCQGGFLFGQGAVLSYQKGYSERRKFWLNRVKKMKVISHKALVDKHGVCGGKITPDGQI